MKILATLESINIDINILRVLYLMVQDNVLMRKKLRGTHCTSQIDMSLSLQSWTWFLSPLKTEVDGQALHSRTQLFPSLPLMLSEIQLGVGEKHVFKLVRDLEQEAWDEDHSSADHWDITISSPKYCHQAHLAGEVQKALKHKPLEVKWITFKLIWARKKGNGKIGRNCLSHECQWNAVGELGDLVVQLLQHEQTLVSKRIGLVWYKTTERYFTKNTKNKRP